jgi:hypothetical protein
MPGRLRQKAPMERRATPNAGPVSVASACAASQAVARSQGGDGQSSHDAHGLSWQRGATRMTRQCAKRAA